MLAGQGMEIIGNKGKDTQWNDFCGTNELIITVG